MNRVHVGIYQDTWLPGSGEFYGPLQGKWVTVLLNHIINRAEKKSFWGICFKLLWPYLFDTSELERMEE